MRTGVPGDRFVLLSRYDLTSQAGREAFNPQFASVHAGGSVQQGLSAAGGVHGFFKQRSAADKRYSLALMNRVITHTVGQAPKRPSFLSCLLLRVRAALSGHDVFSVPNQSMLSTMNIRDMVLVDKSAYKKQPISRGDTIVYKSQKHDNLLLPSRVVALAGDTIEIREGSLFVNEALVPEPYVDGDAAGQEHSKHFAKVIVPAGHVFILGDFRDMSEDSRVIGPVATHCIHARILQGNSNVARRPEG